jgi:hypothetical protein
MEYRGIPITWSQDHDGRRHNPDIGRGRHGIISVGTIQRARVYGKHTDDWEWGMVTPIRGPDALKVRGVAESKEAAIEACNAAYIALMEIEGNYAYALATYDRVEWSRRYYEERRASFGPVDESRGR